MCLYQERKRASRSPEKKKWRDFKGGRRSLSQIPVEKEGLRRVTRLDGDAWDEGKKMKSSGLGKEERTDSPQRRNRVKWAAAERKAALLDGATGRGGMVYESKKGELSPIFGRGGGGEQFYMCNRNRGGCSKVGKSMPKKGKRLTFRGGGGGGIRRSLGEGGKNVR